MPSVSLWLLLLLASGSAAPVATPSLSFAVGDAAVVQGLASAKKHNGRRGVIASGISSGRHSVRLDDSAAVLRVRPSNLQAGLTLAPRAAAAVEPGAEGASGALAEEAGVTRGADDASVALLLPDTTSHTRLVLQPEGVRWLESLHGPVVLVSVVGAYRTGKSFLLNQLMGVSCSDGFTVGHRRETQTKGVWYISLSIPL